MMFEDDGYDIQGPVDWKTASHWIEYDKVNFRVNTWCTFGPHCGNHHSSYRLQTRSRPMSETEIIHTKLEGHSREAIFKAYEIPLLKITVPPPPTTVEESWTKTKSFIKAFL